MRGGGGARAFFQRVHARSDGAGAAIGIIRSRIDQVELLRGFGEFRLMIYGLALTLVVLFMPGGIVQAWRTLVRSR